MIILIHQVFRMFVTQVRDSYRVGGRSNFRVRDDWGERTKGSCVNLKLMLLTR